MKSGIIALVLGIASPVLAASDLVVSTPKVILTVKQDGKLVWNADKDTVAKALLVEIANRQSLILELQGQLQTVLAENTALKAKFPQVKLPSAPASKVAAPLATTLTPATK